MIKSIKTSVLAVLFVGTAIFAQAQTTINEGTAVYEVSAPGMPSSTKVQFNGTISKMAFDSGPASVMVITDVTNKLAVVAVSVPVAQQMIAAKMAPADVEEQKAKSGKATDFVATGVKEMIAGYNAEKYTYKDGDGNPFEVWATTELVTPLNSMTGKFAEVKGTVVKFTGKDTKVSLKSIKEEKVGPLSATTIPSGYDEITYAEMKAMSGGE